MIIGKLFNMRNIIFALIVLSFFVISCGSMQSKEPVPITSTITSKKCYIVYGYGLGAGGGFLKNKKLKKGKEVFVYEIFKELPNYYRIKSDDLWGYVTRDCLVINDEILAYEDGLQREKEEAEEKKKELYGQWYNNVVNRNPVTGMPEKFLEDCMGAPKGKNTTYLKGFRCTQYIYDRMYIYTENGTVTAIQTMNY